MRPGPLQELFPDLTREDWRKEGFAFGEVTKEAVYLTPTAKRKLRIPTPPPFKNHGNEVISVSALARYQQRRPRRAARTSSPRPRRRSCIVEDGKVVGVRSGDKGRGKDGEPLGNFEPGTDIKAKATVLRRGLLGPPHRRRDPRVRPRARAASRRSGSSASRRSGRSPSRWTA